IGANRKP
ncbi:hypothetical protein MKD33_17550, partial [Chromobacterium piscinae]